MPRNLNIIGQEQGKDIPPSSLEILRLRTHKSESATVPQSSKRGQNLTWANQLDWQGRFDGKLLHKGQ
eukprot:3424760-Amphidinium_carterae.1